MWLNKIVVPSAAGAFAAALAPGMALAETADHPIVLSFEGSVGAGNHSKAYTEAKVGESSGLEHDLAFVGSVGLSRSINDAWDWNVSVSHLGNATNSVGEGPFSASFDSNRSEVEFSFGRELALGSAKARLGLGLAYAKASAEKGLDAIVGPSTTFADDMKTEFQGVGPHASFDVQSGPVAADSKLSVIGGVEMSLLAGKYEHSKGIEAYNEGDQFKYSASKSEDGRLMTAGIKIGLQYDANEKTSLHVGIRHDIARMDQVDVGLGHVSVEDAQTSLFAGMNVAF